MSAAILAFPAAMPMPDLDIGPAWSGYLVADGDDLDLPGAALRVHKFRHAIRVTDCTGAGKRGARLVELSVDTDGYGQAGDEQRTAAYRWLSTLPLATGIEDAERWATALGLSVYRSLLRGVDVRPLDVPELVIHGPHVAVSVDHRSASASDRDDRDNEPCALVRNPSLAAARKARALLLAERAAIESGAVGFSRVCDLLFEAGFSVHTWCAVD